MNELRKKVRIRLLTKKEHSEMSKLSNAVDKFVIAMKHRLKEKLVEGYSGWDDGKRVRIPDLITDMFCDLSELDYKGFEHGCQAAIDIANRCMMLYLRMHKEVKK